MQIDRILGNVGVLYVGAYNSSTQYEYLNCVTYNGSSYVCVNQNGVTGVTPGTTNDWQLSAQKGDTGGQGIQGEQGIQGATGNGIQSIEKTSSNALTDTYTIAFTDGSSTTFEVENGKGIVSIEKTSSEGNIDTYTITYNDDTTSTFTVTNGEVTNEELQQALAQERVISDGKYAKALKTQVTDVKSTQIYAENDVVDDLVINGVELTQVVTENSPSLDNPSEIQIASEQNIQICQSNIIDTTDVSTKLSGLDFISNSDGGININGTPTSTWTVIKTQNLTVPIKSGINLYFNYGKTNQLKQDNTDFNVFIRLLDKDNSILYTLNSGFNNVIVGQEVYKIAIGIQGLVLDKSYNEDIYIELEISDEQPTQFQKYESTDITIPLVNSAIGQYADTIDRENNVQNKVIQELILTGDEDWTMAYGDGMFGLENSEIKFNINSKIALSNYFKFNSTTNNIYNTLLDNEFTFQFSNGKQKCFIKCIQFNSITDWKAKLKELYQAGTPVKIYYVAETSTPEPLSEEVKQELDKFKLYDGLNNISIDNGTLSFKYNKSLLKVLEEKDEKIDDLQSQIDEIKALLSSSSTASLLLENLANDNESEVS